MACYDRGRVYMQYSHECPRLVLTSCHHGIGAAGGLPQPRARSALVGSGAALRAHVPRPPRGDRLGRHLGRRARRRGQVAALLQHHVQHAEGRIELVQRARGRHAAVKLGEQRLSSRRRCAD